MGGQTLPPFAPAPERFYNDVWSSEDGKTWTRVLEHAPWTPRGMIGGSAVFRGRMWLLGGGTYDTPDKPQRLYFTEVWSTADGINWKKHADAPWHPRQYHDVAVFDGKMWVMEGGHADLHPCNMKDVWYSADGETWQELPGTPWLPRHAASAFVHAGALWMVAGNNMTSDAWKLTKGRTEP